MYGTQIGKEEVKFIMCDVYIDLIVYVENLMESTKSYQNHLSELSMVSGYKIKIQMSIVFLYTIYNQQETEILN